MRNFIRRSVHLLAIVVVSMVACAVHGATMTILKVDGDSGLTVGGGATGLSWTYAYKYLQDAIVEANGNADSENHYQVWIKGDTDAYGGIIYYPDEGNVVSNNVRSQYFELEDYVAVYGGFQGNEASNGTGFLARDPATYKVYLSGDIDQDGLDNGNAYHVLRASFVGATAILDGATITGGYADGTGDQAFGGGMLIVG